MDKHKENSRRLSNLYKESHNWLLAASYNITKNKETSEDLVGELYCYLGEKVNPSLWWGQNSFNVMYCYSFVKSRFLNKIKRDKKIRYQADNPIDNTPDKEYDIEFDLKIEATYNNIIDELKKMEYTKQWASSKLFQMYAFDDGMTLEKLASEIKISKSTAFLNCKKTKIHLKNTIPNPFRN
jgi:DNA-directed RNA polymerase specialized sigma24 family protein